MGGKTSKVQNSSTKPTTTTTTNTSTTTPHPSSSITIPQSSSSSTTTTTVNIGISTTAITTSSPSITTSTNPGPSINHTTISTTSSNATSGASTICNTTTPPSTTPNITIPPSSTTTITTTPPTIISNSGPSTPTNTTSQPSTTVYGPPTSASTSAGPSPTDTSTTTTFTTQGLTTTTITTTTVTGLRPSTPTGTASINYGWKMIKSLYGTGRHVMYTIFRWGTPGKNLQTDLLTYLNNLQPTSTANYLSANNKERSLNKLQKLQISNNPSGDKFDVTLLFVCIKLACEDVAGLKHQAWNTIGPEFENCVYQIKEQRNKTMHEQLEMTEAEFVSASRELRKLLINTLTTAQQRYSHLSVAQLATEIQKVNNDLDSMSAEPVGVDDLVMQCGPALLLDLISDVTDHLKGIYKDDVLMDPLSFLTGSRLRLQIKKIFTKIKVIMCKQLNKYSDMEYEDILSLCQSGSSTRPQVVVVEGLAGSGKTTLVTLLTQEWVDGGQGSLRGLDNYQLLLRLQCRDSHLSSFNDLLEDLLLPASIQYRSLLPRLIKMCRLIVVVDGLDERNDNSHQLVRDLLDQLQRAPECTFFCTTRPEALQDFLCTIPKRYDVHVVQLSGIPVELRPQFVRRYYEEIKRVTGNTQVMPSNLQNEELLVKKVIEDKNKEHYRLPLNLVILAWLFYFNASIINETTTQAELYHYTHQLCLEKLEERLANNLMTKNMTRRIRKDKVKAWLPNFYLKQLEGLSRNQLTLAQQALDNLVASCAKLDLPEDEVIAAFLSMKTTWTPVFMQEQYAAPHKGLQDYYAALYIVETLKSQTAPGSIMAVMEGALGSGSVDLPKYQNVLQQVACLVYLHLDPVSDTVAQEVVDLLQQAGVTSRDQWLDVVENTKSAPAIIAAVARHFPLPSNTLGNSDLDDVDDDDDCIEIEMGRVKSYSVLLQQLPATRLKIDINEDSTCLNPLLPCLDQHTCVMLHLWRQYNNPEPTLVADHILQRVLDRGGLKAFVGQVSWGLGVRLPPTLTHLRLSISCDLQAAILPHLHSLTHLQDLGIHVTSGVTPTSLTRLPDLRDPDGGSSVFLRLSDLSKGGEVRACEVINTLQPAAGYWDIWFPRARVGEAGWKRVVEGLGAAGVRAGGLRVPENSLTMHQLRGLNHLALTTLGGGMKRYDFERRGWQ